MTTQISSLFPCFPGISCPRGSGSPEWGGGGKHRRGKEQGDESPWRGSSGTHLPHRNREEGAKRAWPRLGLSTSDVISGKSLCLPGP